MSGSFPPFSLKSAPMGVTHSTQERRLPGPPDLGKEQKASTTPESAAQALDGVGLD